MENKDNLTTSTKTNSLFKYLLPLLLVLTVIYYLANKGCGEKIIQTTSVEADVAIDTTGQISAESIKAAFESTNETEVRKMENMSFEEGSISDQLFKFIQGGLDGNPVFTLKNANFPTGSADMSAETKAELNIFANVLQAYPDLKISFDGHTDNSGDATLNQFLSEKRAESLKTYLVKIFKINESRLEVKGFGPNRPVSSNTTEEGRTLNNRIEIRIIN